MKKIKIRNKFFLILPVFLLTVATAASFALTKQDASLVKKSSNLSTIKKVSQAFTPWKNFKNNDFSASYPENWSLLEGDTFFTYDPEKTYVTHSRPPIQYYEYVRVSWVEKTGKSATEYAEGEYQKRAAERKDYEEFWNQVKQDPKNAGLKSDPDAFPQFTGRVTMRKGNMVFEAYNMYPKSAGNYQHNKTFAVSNGKLLLVGEAIFDGFDDGSIESRIVKSIELVN